MAYIVPTPLQHHEYDEQIYQPVRYDREPDGGFLFFKFYKEVAIPVGRPHRFCSICLEPKGHYLHKPMRLEATK